MLSEAVRIFGISIFEILLNCIGFIIFLVFLSFKLDENSSFSWWFVFSPLYCASSLAFYFTIIVFFRDCIENDNRQGALKRLMWASQFYFNSFAFVSLLCVNLSAYEDDKAMRTSLICSPLFIFLVLILIRMCKFQWQFIFYYYCSKQCCFSSFQNCVDVQFWLIRYSKFF